MCIDRGQIREARPRDELKVGNISDTLPQNEDESGNILVQSGEGTGKKRILIADDSEDMLQLLSETLKILNYDYSGAKDGVEAFTLLNREHFDLVISDIRMPRMSGVKLLRIAKEHTPHLPFILITGYRPSYAEETVLRAHADGYLIKPFSFMELKKEIDEVLGEKI